MRPGFVILLIGIALAAGCLTPGGNGPAPTPNVTYTPTQLKYLLLDHYGEDLFFFCDPDYYPVARGDEQERAIAVFPTIANETTTFAAITARKGLHPPYSNETKLLIYREYKKLAAITSNPMGDTVYSFTLLLGATGEGQLVNGVIRNDGAILGEKYFDAVLTCPICLPGGTLIDTPSGAVRVEDIRAGMMVLSPGPNGTREAVPILHTGKTRVSPGHLLTHLRLSDGREISASPGHPALDGRVLGSLAVGEGLDGAVVISTGLVPTGGAFTYDILPAGNTGGYWADGIPLKSTLG